ncbi:hypothetical protein BDN71DRAFT_1437445 [Pleurotus eryngii]|uniref:Uncharacterized protein n=1 Tax=Pleurotus eryngii TaxID=5323 RepID=A0A9P5ZGF0_PLEER|nr:hypothetical protein BDN71DRAFT_1437445 [Pleurotus eryngii]
MPACGKGGLLRARKVAGREALGAAPSFSPFLVCLTEIFFTGTKVPTQEPTEATLGQPVTGVKTFFISQRLFEEQREREALDAAGERVDSDDEKEVEQSMNGGAEAEASTSHTASAWEEPLSPLSSVPPSPTTPPANLPSEPIPGGSTKASAEDDDERERTIQEQAVLLV